MRAIDGDELAEAVKQRLDELGIEYAFTHRLSALKGQIEALQWVLATIRQQEEKSDIDYVLKVLDHELEVFDVPFDGTAEQAEGMAMAREIINDLKEGSTWIPKFRN